MALPTVPTVFMYAPSLTLPVADDGTVTLT